MYFLYAPVSNKNKIKNLKNIYSLNYHRDLFYKNKYHSIKYLNFNISQSQIGTLNKKINIVFDEQLILIQKFFDKNLRIKRDKKYYEFKFGYWMLHIISNYFYFEKILRLLKKKKILPIQNIYQHKIKLRNTDHFFEILRTSEYQNYLFSNFLNENNISSIKIDENFKSLNRFSKKKSVTKFLYYYLINILFKFINPRSIICDSISET